MLCIVCDKEIPKKNKEYCSRKCKYSSAKWRNSVKSDAYSRKGYGLKICLSCNGSFAPTNYKQKTCILCITSNTPINLDRKWTSPSQQPEYKKRIYREKQAQIFNYFGNKCNKCGFADTRALQIDHVNGGGNIERKTVCGIPFLNKVLKVLYSGKYQLLCANCNWIKRAESKQEQPKGKQIFV